MHPVGLKHRARRLEPSQGVPAACCAAHLSRQLPCAVWTIPAGLATAVGALDRADKRRLAAATAAYERSGGEEEAQLLFDARAALVRLHALLAVGGAASGAAAAEDEVYDGLHRLLEVSLALTWCAVLQGTVG